MRGSITQARDKAIKLMLIKIMYKSLVTHSKCHNIFSPLFFHFRFLRFVCRSLSVVTAVSVIQLVRFVRPALATASSHGIAAEAVRKTKEPYCIGAMVLIVQLSCVLLSLLVTYFYSCVQWNENNKKKTQILAFHTKCRQDKNVATWAKTTTRREGKWREKKRK